MINVQLTDDKVLTRYSCYLFDPSSSSVFVDILYLVLQEYIDICCSVVQRCSSKITIKMRMYKQDVLQLHTRTIIDNLASSQASEQINI